MEYRPNSRPEESSPLQNATIIWQGPKYLNFNTKDSRLKSYTHWPHDMNPSPDSLSVAGFYYTGIYIFITISHCIATKKHYLRVYIRHFIYRSKWWKNMFSLWWRVKELASRWWRMERTRTLVSVLCLHSLYLGRRIHSRMSKLLFTLM